LYCLSGKRSSDAATQMDALGFNNIYTLEGGLKNWNAEGLETVKP
jgi:rhodanese-related sulfurtransferase